MHDVEPRVYSPPRPLGLAPLPLAVRLTQSQSRYPHRVQSKNSNAIQSMGAQYFEPNLPATTRKLWQLTWPGWLGSLFRHFKLYADDTVVSDLAPMSASFRGAPGQAEAIYESPQGSLVRVRFTEGEGSAVTPVHSVVLGGTSAGKSVTLADLNSQTWPFFDHRFILDSGRSHETWATVVLPGLRPIVVRPNGSVRRFVPWSHRIPCVGGTKGWWPESMTAAKIGNSVARP